MASNYFIEYTHFLNDIQNKLMRIQLRFNGCLESIRRDIASGIISPLDGEILLRQRMDKYYGGVDSKYRLSNSDVEFIRQYAAVDNNGQLLASFLKREYLDKRDKLSAILESLRIYGYLDTLSEKDARLSVKIAMHDHYSSKLGEVEQRMSNLLQMYGDKEKHTRRYAELDEQRNKLQKALNAVATLDKVPQETFDRIVSQFYDVERKYYEWFLKMEIKREYEVGSVYQEHCDTMSSIDSTSNAILTSSDQVVKLTSELEDTNRDLFNVLMGISTFDINSALGEQEKPKKRLFGKVEEPNNKEKLLNVFIGLMSINGITSYVKEMFGNGDSSVSLNNAFYTYFNKKYGEDTMYVEPVSFINDLRDDVVSYYKDKIEDLINKINGLNVKINSNTTLMCGNIRVGMNQAGLQRDIREQYPAKRDELLIPGFTFDELERIYTDLKEFIGNGFSFGTDDEELFLRKV